MTRVLCAGDAFISAALLASVVREEIGDVEIGTDDSAWPDEPFRDSADISEWVGAEDRIAELASDVDIVVTHVAPIGRRVARRRRPAAVGGLNPSAL